MSDRRVHPIWSGPRNPPSNVATTLGVSRWRLREILHEIERRSKLGATDRVTIYDDGRVMTSLARMSEISATKPETGQTIRAFATLRFSGDRLDPEHVTSALRRQPTLAYRIGEVYRINREGRETRGRTGVWLLSTRRLFPGSHLVDHLTYLVGILSSDVRPAIRKIMDEDGVAADVSCFWHGQPGAEPPSIPADITAVFAELPAEIELDFDTD